MKKALSLILALVMCLSLCACGGGDPSIPTNNEATVITNEGETVEVSAQDLFDEYDANEARFIKIYHGSTIEFTGTVKQVEVNATVVSNLNSVGPGPSKIVFEEGWCLVLGKDNTKFDLADYYPGQKLEVSTGIISPAYDTEFLKKVANYNRVVWLAGNDLSNKQNTRITPINE